MAMQVEGTPLAEAQSKIWMVDSKGLIVVDRPEGGLTQHKLHYAQKRAPIKTLLEVVKTAKPTVLIGEIISRNFFGIIIGFLGASAIPGSFSTEILQAVGANTARPIIFALSNPTSKAECTAEQAYTATNVSKFFF